jgi:NarL family two-component system response regulator LiaR
MASPIRVVVADDHAVVREGLRTFLRLEDDFELVGEAADGEAAVAEVERHGPDVALVDLVMPGIDGVEAIRRIREESPGTDVIVLTSFTEDEKIFPALQAGAVGYLLKDVQPRELAQAIRAVAAGKAILDPAMTARLLRELAATERREAGALTAREQDVLRLLARGLSNREIARELVLSEKTVKTHVSHILAKLRLADRTQAALYAVRAGLAEHG